MSQNLSLLLDRSVTSRSFLSSRNLLLRPFLAPRNSLLSILIRLCRLLKISLPLTVRTFWGESFKVLLPGLVSSEIARFGYIENPVCRFMLATVNKGDTVIDIGAHYGFFTRLLAYLASPTGRIYSFEPTPSTYHLLSLNTRRYPNITTLPFAVWSQPTDLTIHDYGAIYSAFNSVLSARLPGNHQDPGATTHRVPAVSLDEFILDHNIKPSFIKIDAESAEYHILTGMRNTLQQLKPTICLELGDLGVDGAIPSSSILEYLTSFDYVPYQFSDGHITVHKCLKTYPFTNLLFIHKSSTLTKSHLTTLP